MSAQPSSRPQGAHWSKKYPDLGSGKISTKPYMDTDYFNRELKAVFRTAWLNVGRLDDLPEDGAYRVLEFPPLNSSVILVRGPGDTVRAFHNVCLHRANKLVMDDGGKAARFTCRYHGWTYANDGRLLSVPDEDKFENFDKPACGLKAVASGMWNGFVFINLAARPAEGLGPSLADLAPLFQGYPFASLERRVTYEAQVRANWKVCMDIGKEPYHFLFVHRKSIPDSHTGVGQELAYFPAIRLYDKHRSASINANPNHRPRPAESIAFEQMATIIQGGDAAAHLPACLNPDKVENWAFDVHIIYPNCAVLLGVGWSVVHRFWPLAVDLTHWQSTLYMTRPANAGEAVSQEFSKILTRDLLREDMAMCEANQAGLAQNVLPDIWLSDEEIMLRHGYAVIEHAIAQHQGQTG